jgi:hypothetical protein
VGRIVRSLPRGRSRRRIAKNATIGLVILVSVLGPVACTCGLANAAATMASGPPSTHACHHTSRGHAPDSSRHDSDCAHCHTVLAVPGSNRPSVAPCSVSSSPVPLATPTRVVAPRDLLQRVLERAEAPPTHALLRQKCVLLI